MTKHLSGSVLEHLDTDIESRIEFIHTPRWIGHPKALEVLRKFDDLYRYPRQSRMPSVLLVGDSNSGKTRLAKQFAQRHPASENPDGEFIDAPVMYFEAPPKPSEAGFYVQILSTLYQRVPAASTDAKRARVISVLRGVGLKVMIIDELHNLLAGSSTNQQQFLNMIKYLSNELDVSIIGCGTSHLTRAVSVDSQIQNRFTPIVLTPWKMDRNFLQLLRSFESILPLREESNLVDTFMARKLLAMSEGTIGELSTLLNQAAVYALRSDQERITVEILDKCGYVAPGDRTTKASTI